MATSLTSQPSPGTVKFHAGTLAGPRLVRTVTRPGVAPVTVSWLLVPAGGLLRLLIYL
jgi:hypothetical protein